VTDAANSMGEDTLDEFQMVMNGISDVFNNTDIDPVITPVVDLSEIQNGVDAINSMSDQIDLSTSIAYANSASPFTTGTPLTVMQDELAKLSASLSGTGNNQQTTNNNTFNITSTDPKGAADEVSRILQQQVERRNAVWA
jgi:hypothetical protein